jgi:Zn-dependent protease with chaperone function
MRINSAVLLVLLLLVAVLGWFAASAASPKLVTLLMGVAIGAIVTMPVMVLVARILWSEELRAMRRRERRHQAAQPRHARSYPPVIVVPSHEPETADYTGPIFTSRPEDRQLPPIHYLGED